MGKRGPKPKPKVTTDFGSVSKETYQNFMGGVAHTKGKLDDVRVANANEWKKTETLGIHAFAAKLMLKLRRMEPLARNDFLRAFDRYRAFEAFDEADLIDQAEEAATAEAQAAENEEIRETEIEERRTAAAEAGIDRGFSEIEESVGVDDGDIPQDEIDLEDVKEEGRQAALRATKINENPYDSNEHPDAYEAWQEGAEEIFNQGRFGELKEAAA